METTNETNSSGFLKLKTADFWKGVIMAFFSSVTAALYSALVNDLDLSKIDWKLILTMGIIGFLAYLQKNLFTNSDGTPFKKEPIN